MNDFEPMLYWGEPKSSNPQDGEKRKVSDPPFDERSFVENDGAMGRFLNSADYRLSTVSCIFSGVS